MGLTNMTNVDIFALLQTVATIAVTFAGFGAIANGLRQGGAQSPIDAHQLRTMVESSILVMVFALTPCALALFELARHVGVARIRDTLPDRFGDRISRLAEAHQRRDENCRLSTADVACRPLGLGGEPFDVCALRVWRAARRKLRRDLLRRSISVSAGGRPALLAAHPIDRDANAAGLTRKSLAIPANCPICSRDRVSAERPRGSVC